MVKAYNFLEIHTYIILKQIKEDIIQDRAIIKVKADFIQAMVTNIATKVCIIDNYYNSTLTLVSLTIKWGYII
jgi:hypothetical protein